MVAGAVLVSLSRPARQTKMHTMTGMFNDRAKRISIVIVIETRET